MNPTQLYSDKYFKPDPFTLCHGYGMGTPQFAVMVHNFAQLCPRGFRQPSAKAKNWQSTSLVEKASIAAGMMPPPRFERSKRGEAKAQRDLEFRLAYGNHDRSPKYLSAHQRRRTAARGG